MLTTVLRKTWASKNPRLGILSYLSGLPIMPGFNSGPSVVLNEAYKLELLVPSEAVLVRHVMVLKTFCLASSWPPLNFFKPRLSSNTRALFRDLHGVKGPSLHLRLRSPNALMSSLHEELQMLRTQE